MFTGHAHVFLVTPIFVGNCWPYTAHKLFLGVTFIIGSKHFMYFQCEVHYRTNQFERSLQMEHNIRNKISYNPAMKVEKYQLQNLDKINIL